VAKIVHLLFNLLSIIFYKGLSSFAVFHIESMNAVLIDVCVCVCVYIQYIY